MKVNGKLVSDLRKKYVWSQDELATAAGLNLRTVQRIENVGTASLQLAKAIASALEVGLDDLRHIPEKKMSKFEYKTLVLPFQGRLKTGLPDIEAALNKEGGEGWQFKQMAFDWSKWTSMIVILERAVE